MALESLMKKNGRRFFIALGLIPAIIFAGLWCGKYAPHSVLYMSLGFFIVNGFVSAFSYIGRLWQSYLKIDVAESEKLAQKPKRTRLKEYLSSHWKGIKRFFSFGKDWINKSSKQKENTTGDWWRVFLFTLAGCAVGAYAIFDHSRVMGQFQHHLPSTMIYIFYVFTCLSILSSLSSRIYDSTRAPAINKGIRYGVIAGLAIATTLFVGSLALFHLGPMATLSQICSHAYGTLGITLGPSHTGTILGLLSFVVVGASVGEYCGKIWLCYLSPKKKEERERLRTQYASNPTTALTGNPQDTDALNTKASVENFWDFLGASLGGIVGAGIGGLIVYYGGAIHLSLMQGILLGTFEVVIGIFTGTALGGRIGSLLDWEGEDLGRGTSYAAAADAHSSSSAATITYESQTSPQEQPSSPTLSKGFTDPAEMP